MTVQEERRVRRVDPDLHAEQEVDFGSYGRTVAQRWWLPILGLVAGAFVGYLLSLGGGTVYRAQALVYLGQPIGPSGNAVPGLNGDLSTVRTIVTSESVVRQVAREVGIRPAELRREIAANPVQTSDRRAGQTTALQITVRGKRPARVRAAANQLSTILVDQLSRYTRAKLRLLSAQRESSVAVLESLNKALAQPGLSLDTRLLLQLRIVQAQQDVTQSTQSIEFARDIESPRILTPAAAQETTARSQRNSIVVGALIGLILGTIASLLWEPLVERRRTQP